MKGWPYFNRLYINNSNNNEMVSERTLNVFRSISAAAMVSATAITVIILWINDVQWFEKGARMLPDWMLQKLLGFLFLYFHLVSMMKLTE